AGGGTTPTARATRSTDMTAVSPASMSTKGLAATAARRSPAASRVDAVVIPHIGHGMPVSVRSGQGRPSPVWRLTAGYPNAAAVAPRPARPSRSDTEYGRRTGTGRDAMAATGQFLQEPTRCAK